jgi:hypothetical protein
MLSKNKILISLILLGCAIGIANAKYKPTEVLVIPWGDGPNQLAIQAARLDSAALPDTIPIDGAGPTKGFVDRKGNIFIGSDNMNYLKGFDKTGNVIVDLEGDTAASINRYDSTYDAYSDSEDDYSADDYTTESDLPDPVIGDTYHINGLYIFYVDDNSHIYIEGMFGSKYIPVVDFSGKIVDRLGTPNSASGAVMSNLKWSSDDILTFIDGNTYEYYAYHNGRISPTDNGDWLAKDHFYYYVGAPSDSVVMFSRTGNAAFNPAYADSATYSQKPIDVTGIFPALLGVSDDMRLFVLFPPMDGAADTRQIIRVYNRDFQQIDDIIIPRQISNKYNWRVMDLFLRPLDGAVYDFRVKNDGLHVMRWAVID